MKLHEADEVSSYIDPDNERIIQKAISALTREKTVLVIAHRLSTIANADQILVIDDGQIVERGGHDDLMNSAGLYRRFWMAQSASTAATGATISFSAAS
ncbi:MAG: hypothetical protein WAW37_07015 [Syntrophobacteraceae bacterium]